MQRDTRFAAGWLFSFLVLFFSPLASAEDLKTDTALRWAPASAAFFSTSLRIGEQWHEFAESNAYKKLAALPLTQMAIGEIKKAWNNPEEEGIRHFRDFWTASENSSLREVLCDAVSHEIFTFGDRNVTGLFGVLTEFNQQINSLQWKMIGKEDKEAAQKEAMEAIIDSMGKRLGGMQVPRMAMGFRVTKKDKARAELGRLAQLVEAGLKQVHGGAFADRFTHKSSNDSDLLTMRLDSSMIPWDQLKKESEEDAELIDRVAAILKDKTLVLNLGLYQDYLVITTGADQDITAMFQSKELLIDSPALARLRPFASKPLTSIGYASAEFMRGLSGPKEQLNQIAAATDAALPQAQIDDAIKEQIAKDVREMVGDIQKFIPVPGAVLSFAFETEDGMEGYTENGSENFFLDGSKSLDVLNHVGKDPIILAATRMRLDNPAVGFVGKWFHRLGFYVEKFAVEQGMSEVQRSLYTKFTEGMGPVCSRLGDAYEQHMQKAFQDGQAAFVLDAKLDPKPQWHMMMPPAEDPLPMPEFAWIYPITNRMEFEAGLQAYSESAEAMIAKFKELVTENAETIQQELEGPAQALPMIVQNLRLPPTDTREVDDGKIVYQTSLQSAGVDAALAPCMGWNSKALVFALGPDTAERLLKVEPITGPLKESASAPAAAVSMVDFSRLVGIVRPWVVYGMGIAAQQDESGMIAQIQPQVDTILEVFQCWREFHSVTTVEQDKLVVHFRTTFKDLEE